jgi:hypothetical protein
MTSARSRAHFGFSRREIDDGSPRGQLRRSFTDVIGYKRRYHSLHSQRAQDVGLNWCDPLIKSAGAEIQAADSAHRPRPCGQFDQSQNCVGDFLRPGCVLRGEQLREMRNEIVANR